tara:strand:+ start:118 stop:1191 length:1074 start_codon:yes stop_codon:yes gene_type:complete
MFIKLTFLLLFLLNFNAYSHDFPQSQAIDGYDCKKASEINLTDQCRKSRKWTEPYDGVLYDCHIHPNHTKNIDKYIEELNFNKYEFIVVADTPNGYKKILKGNEKHKKRLKKISKMYNSRVLCGGHVLGFIEKGRFDLAREYLNEAISDIEAGECVGFGELGIQHFDKSCDNEELLSTVGRQSELILDKNNEIFLEMYDYANKNKLLMDIHYEPARCQENPKTNESVDYFKEVCSKYPNIKFSLAHTGMITSKKLDELMTSCPNIYSSIKPIMKPSGWVNLEPPNNISNEFFEDWALLFEKYPDRFYLGSDWKENHRYYDISLTEHTDNLRHLIGSLNKQVQDDIAINSCKNLFDIE